MALDEMPFSTSAYLGDTQHLSLQQHGAYTLILWSMWRSGGWIADDEKMLARICKTNVTGWRKLAPVVRALLLERDGRLTQKRLLATYEECLDQHQKRVLAGSSGGKAKALKSKEAYPSNATDLLESEQNAPPSLFPSLVDSERKKGGRQRSKLPDDWILPPDWFDWASGEGVSEADIFTFAKSFSAHWHSTGELKANWYATWQKWCLNEIKWAKHRHERNQSRSENNGKKSVIEAGKRLLATMAGPQPVRPNGAAQARAGFARDPAGNSDVRMLPER